MNLLDIAPRITGRRDDTSHASDALTQAAVGAAAGLLGTFVMQGMLAATRKWLPQGMPPIRRDPGEFMVHQAERALPPRFMQRIPDPVEHGAAMSLHLGYGAFFGAMYGLLRGRGGGGGARWIEGPLLGLACWAAGYLGWLPLSGLMPPLWKQRPTQVATPAAEHALYGMATVAAYDAIHHLIHPRD